MTILLAETASGLATSGHELASLALILGFLGWVFYLLIRS